MTELKISLPDDLRDFIDRQVATGDYGTIEGYINHLLRQEQERVAEKRLETLLIEGLDSGDPVEADEDWWTRKRSDLAKRLPSSTS